MSAPERVAGTPQASALSGEGLEPFEGRAELRPGESLRGRTARGTIINAAFGVGTAALDLLRRLLVAAFLTASEFGLWGLLIGGLLAIVLLKQVGVTDKYIQQAEDDQEVAFQKAFTLELLSTLGFYVVIAAALPTYALLIGRPEIILPGFVLSLVVLALAFQSPNWIWMRRMEYLKQRLIAVVDPALTFLITVPLAIVGLGYWSLVIGAVTGSVIGAVVAVWASPYRLAIRFDRETLREYFHFSWPLLVVSGSNLLMIQLYLVVGEATLGLAAVGVIGLTAAITTYADRVNIIVTRTIYPAVCAVRHRTDLLFESFTKSNRLGLMWAVPFGLCLTLFAPDLVRYGLGPQWTEAAPVLQAFGVITAVKQVAWNWTAFMRALNETRPMAVSSVLSVITFAAIGVPLMITAGITGYVIAMSAVILVQVAVRGYYLQKLFTTFALVPHAVRAAAPVLPAVAGILLLRLVEGGQRTLTLAIGELAVYVAVTALATFALERDLLREIRGYLRRPRRVAAARAG